MITEATKAIVLQQKNALKRIYLANMADINEHKEAITKIQAVNLALKAQYEALDADIPEPVVVEE